MSEWQRDKFGQQYRIGALGEIEYRMKVQTTNGTFYQDELPSSKQLEEAEAARIKKEREKTNAMETGKICPFKLFRRAYNVKCEKRCSFYQDGCRLADQTAEPVRDTLDRPCPIGDTCKALCALWNGGCRFKGIAPGKD